MGKNNLPLEISANADTMDSPSAAFANEAGGQLAGRDNGHQQAENPAKFPPKPGSVITDILGRPGKATFDNVRRVWYSSLHRLGKNGTPRLLSVA